MADVIDYRASKKLVRLQNSRVFFPLKISKEIGKAWRKRREKKNLPSLALCFQPRSRPFV